MSVSNISFLSVAMNGTTKDAGMVESIVVSWNKI